MGGPPQETGVALANILQQNRLARALRASHTTRHAPRVAGAARAPGHGAGGAGEAAGPGGRAPDGWRRNSRRILADSDPYSDTDLDCPIETGWPTQKCPGRRRLSWRRELASARRRNLAPRSAAGRGSPVATPLLSSGRCAQCVLCARMPQVMRRHRSSRRCCLCAATAPAARTSGFSDGRAGRAVPGNEASKDWSIWENSRARPTRVTRCKACTRHMIVRSCSGAGPRAAQLRNLCMGLGGHAAPMPRHALAP